MGGRVLVAVLTLVVSVAGASAQVDPTVGSPLSLADAEQRALDLNPQVTEARLGTEAADFSVVQARAVFGTTFSTSLTHRGQTNPATSQLAGGRTTVDNNTSSFGTTLAKPLEGTGGNVSVSFTNDRTATSNTFANFNPSYSSSLAATVVQPLLRGRTINSQREQVQQARLNVSAADTAVRQQVAQITANVRRAYWDLVYTADALQTARQSRDLADRQLAENQLRLQLGTVAQIDVLQSQAEVAARTQAAVQAEGAWRTAQVSLKQLIVANTSDPIWETTVVPTDRPALEAVPQIDVSAAVARALTNRTDIEAVRRQGEGLDINLRLLDDQRRPAVDLNAGLTLNGLGGTQLLRDTGLGGTATGTIPGGYFDALQTLGKFDFPTWVVGLNVSVPLSTSVADASAARSRVQRRQVDARLNTLELQVAATITRLADQVVNANEQVQAAGVARQLAEQRLDVENTRLQVGLTTTFLVLQAQRDLATAQTSELQALLNLRKAMVDFEQAQEAP